MCCSTRSRAKEPRGREFDPVCSRIVAALRGLVLTISSCHLPPFCFCLPWQSKWLVFLLVTSTGFCVKVSWLQYVIFQTPHASSRDPTALLNPGIWLVCYKQQVYIHALVIRFRFSRHGLCRATRLVDGGRCSSSKSKNKDFCMRHLWQDCPVLKLELNVN